MKQYRGILIAFGAVSVLGAGAIAFFTKHYIIAGAVLGVALTNVQNEYNFVESVLAGFGTAVGFTLAIVLLASIRSRIREEDLPKPLRGAPIVLISAALMSIAFMGFSGLSF